MKKILLWALLPVLWVGCKNVAPKTGNNLGQLMSGYWEDRMKMFPVEATGYGDNRYNDQLTITIAESFRESCKRMYQRYADALNGIDTATLSPDDLVSYRLLRYELAMDLEGMKYPAHLIPINQFWAFTLDLPQ